MSITQPIHRHPHEYKQVVSLWKSQPGCWGERHADTRCHWCRAGHQDSPKSLPEVTWSHTLWHPDTTELVLPLQNSYSLTRCVVMQKWDILLVQCHKLSSGYSFVVGIVRERQMGPKEGQAENLRDETGSNHRICLTSLSQCLFWAKLISKTKQDQQPHHTCCVSVRPSTPMELSSRVSGGQNSTPKKNGVPLWTDSFVLLSPKLIFCVHFSCLLAIKNV